MTKIVAFILLGILFIATYGTAQQCPQTFQYHPSNKSCVGKPFNDAKMPCLPGYTLLKNDNRSVCSGPPFDCPGQPGYGRVFSENDPSATVCTKADSVDVGENGKCPNGYYHSSVAQPPYNDLCISRTSSKTKLTPEERRTSIAEHAQLQSEHLLPERKWKYAATGIGKRTFRISAPAVGDEDINGLFRGGMAYAEWLWKSGFRLTVLTDGRRFWAAALNADGYHGVDGPLNTEPTEQAMNASKKTADLPPPVPDNQIKGRRHIKVAQPTGLF